MRASLSQCNSLISSREVGAILIFSQLNFQHVVSEFIPFALITFCMSNHSWPVTRNSVAVAPAFAHCTNRCTRRKVTVTAQFTKQENRKMKKRSQHENTKLPIRSPRAALLYIRSKWEGENKKGRAEWLRITGSILTPESSKNQGAFTRKSRLESTAKLRLSIIVSKLISWPNSYPSVFAHQEITAPRAPSGPGRA